MSPRYASCCNGNGDDGDDNNDNVDNNDKYVFMCCLNSPTPVTKKARVKKQKM
jgi:hypothetical protein